jgi:AcrR family transcriptional regulator
MSGRKASSHTRRAILEAANQLVLSRGVANLTLEAVARQAGVSKGGLLYHFPSKESLVEGMIDYLLGCLAADIDRAAVQESGAAGPGRWLRAYISATFSPSLPAPDIGAGMLAAVASNPELLAPLRARYDEWQRQAERDGIDPALATVVRLAADGLWLANLLGMALPTGALRARVREALIELTRERQQ